MIVCVCKNLSDKDLKEMLKKSDLEVIQQATGAGTQCTTCLETLKEIAESIDK